jgi:RNA 2',3'-cyclic 3'-phosphodiesterase
MRLFAAIVPPAAVLTEVRAVVDGARRPEPLARATKRGFRARFGAQPEESAPEGDVVDDQLTVPERGQMYLPITHFGNVTLGDSVQLIKALRTEAATWQPATVHVAGGTALEFKGDDSVWAKIAGDVDALQVIGRGVPQIVQRLGFFVDRRQFRPWLSVGRITESTTAPYLQKVVDALDAFRSQPWAVEGISLMKRLPEEGNDAFEETEYILLGG